jgi:DUF4097 and DUF4098 domain-containing protein YvlB
MTFRFLLAGACVALAAAPLAAQRTAPRDARESIDTTFAFAAADGSVELEDVSGEVRVTTWVRNAIRVRAWVENGTLEREFSRDRVRLGVDDVRGRLGDHEFDVAVPAGTRVRARSVSGSVVVTGIRADVEAQSVSGTVSVRDAQGRLELESVSGDVEGRNVSGDVRASAVSGDVLLRGVRGPVEAESVSGNIELAEIASEDVAAESVSGRLTFRGALAAAGRYRFETHSGDIRLEVPGAAKASVRFRTWSGEVDSDFAMTRGSGEESRGGRVRDRDRGMSFTLNGDGAQLELETFSGNVVIRKAGNAGKEN